MLRRALRADIPGMHRVRLAVRENTLSSPDRITEADYISVIEGLGCGWVIVWDGAIVAFAFGLRSGNIWALFVDPDHEGRGHGKHLHSTMVDWLWSQGHTHLWLTTTPGTRAEQFYIAQGWRPCEIVSGGERRFELLLNYSCHTE
jgi:GNAT superfamily N-acetyltransferase